MIKSSPDSQLVGLNPLSVAAAEGRWTIQPQTDIKKGDTFRHRPFQLLAAIYSATMFSACGPFWP